MNKRKLFYKDISGLRFVATIFIYVYIIAYLLFAKEVTEIGTQFGPFVSTLKNIGISIFLIISSFLLTAHALREYKHTDRFNLKNFYIRRLLRLVPTLILVLTFFIVIHPLVVNFLKLNPITDISAIEQIVFFPSYRLKISNEVFIYLFFIYGIFLLLQYYFFWGLVLKYLRRYLPYILSILFVIGIIFRCLPNTAEFTTDLFLPFYFVEIAIGGTVAIIVREKSRIVNIIKSFSKSQITAIYLFSILAVVSIYLLTNSVYTALVGKVVLYCLIGFFIIEQTYSKQSITKIRNKTFIIEFGNLSYSFILFAPIVAVMTLITFESVEIELASRVTIMAFPMICFLLTWFLSTLNKHYIEDFFERVKKSFKT
ncbi:MAG: acyltransferase family protein [Crocinitomicaceae bacterium]